MSVINQMLKDLDERQNRSQAGVPSSAALVSAHQKTWIWPVSLVVLVLILAGLFREPLSSWLTRAPQSVTDKIAISDESTESVAEAPEEFVIRTGARHEPPQVKEQVVAEDVMLTALDVKPQPEKEPVVEENNIANEVVTEIPKIVKSSPAKDKRVRAEALYEQLIETYGPGLSLAQMQEILALDAGFHKVRILWLSRLNQIGDDQFELETKQAINRYPEVFQYRQMLARSLVVEQPKQAYDLLTADIPAIKQAPDYHGLIAYSAKQMGEYTLAAKQYQLLLREYPERADWWLALGLTEEQLGKSSNALVAYQQSLRFPGLTANTRAWAEQRIRALQGY